MFWLPQFDKLFLKLKIVSQIPRNIVIHSKPEYWELNKKEMNCKVYETLSTSQT